MADRQKKIPMRQCLGCREHKPKKELVRIVHAPDGQISLDLTGKANGRGAYVCRSVQCLQKAVKSKALSRAFGAEIPEEVLKRLEEEIEGENAG
jgi:hypothetical protein